MATRTTLEEVVPEGATAKLTGTIVAEDGVTGFLPASLTLTLFNRDDGAIVNNVSAVDILNTGRGTVSGAGALVLELYPADNVIVNTRAGKTTEDHIALLEWAWNVGSRKGKHEIAFTVGDYLKVT
jgi:hypothetical protein